MLTKKTAIKRLIKVIKEGKHYIDYNGIRYWLDCNTAMTGKVTEDTRVYYWHTPSHDGDKEWMYNACELKK